MLFDPGLRRPSCVVAAALCFVSASAMALSRCVDGKGKVTYQDAPCDGEAATRRGEALGRSTGTSARADSATPQAPRVVESNPYGDAHGSWRGPAQFQLTVANTRDGSAQLVAPIVIELKATGEVVGVIPEAGCSLSGLATQFVAANMASVDVSLKGCRDTRFNVRYSGMLASVAASREAKLTLNSISTQMPSRKIQAASIEAVLKR